jgi:hypothetical protein
MPADGERSLEGGIEEVVKGTKGKKKRLKINKLSKKKISKDGIWKL